MYPVAVPGASALGADGLSHVITVRHTAAKPRPTKPDLASDQTGYWLVAQVRPPNMNPDMDGSFEQRSDAMEALRKTYSRLFTAFLQVSDCS